MGWDADRAERYGAIAESLAKLAEAMGSSKADKALKGLLLSMCASYEDLARHYRAREETAHLRCGEGALQETEADRQQNLAVQAIYEELQEQWVAVAAALEKSAEPGRE